MLRLARFALTRFLVPCRCHIENDHLLFRIGFFIITKCKTISNKDPGLEFRASGLRLAVLGTKTCLLVEVARAAGYRPKGLGLKGLRV